MNTLLLEHFAAVSKIAAYRQAREHQQGVDVSGGYLISTDAGLRFGGPRTFEVFFRYEFVDHSQYIGGFQSPTISVVVPYNERERDLIYMYCGSTYVWLPIISGNYYHAVISYDGSEAVCYLNGVEVGRKSFEGDVASLQFRIGAQSQPPKGPIYFCRHYNCALSAEEISALWNNGDPAGYVLPAARKSGERRCVAEYLPQNLVVARKQDFPQVVFPVSTYTPSADVFRSNGQSITTAIPDQPQSNGFSGAFERFDSVTEVSTYCAYWHTYLNQQVPVRIIFEYRSNYPIYASQLSAGINATDIIEVAEANEGDARISSVAYGKGGAAFLFTRKYNDAWLEIRVLSIEVAEGTILSWLDSASQLPLNDEYLPPLLETAGSYDLTANGTPEIIYWPTLISIYQQMVPMTLDKFVNIRDLPDIKQPEIVDGVLRITNSQISGTNAGGGYYQDVYDAHIGDTVEFEYEARATDKFNTLMVGPSYRTALYYVVLTKFTSEFQKHKIVISDIEYPVNCIWFAKVTSDINPGHIEIRNITVKVYRK